ncbi:E3 ubiquitin-protein ligase Topors isoform X2 [Maniola jurtina]|uniref:E3 ubiquitin-protein ligase Topors isoform X2 n=1 Tax=Maniola jurtina TaxID=191418 RepID=UPI001E68A8F5|nr:E3 ubiquitin-protein ligase Topors isoform X2 [Maniola jurtina]
MDSLPIRAPDGSPGTTTNSVKSDDSSPRHDPGRGSPPPNCAICLGTCRNKSFTDSCLHQFCFKCLLTWSKVKAECPLCKQNFRSIIHNVRSNHQYEEYMVEQRHTEELSERIDIDNLTATRRFRYRTTLTLPRQNTIAIQQLLLHHYPMVAELFPGPPAPRRRSPASFRRTVYRYNLWARPLPDFTRRFRDCSPDFYRHNPSQMHRLVPWLNRELHYLLNENLGHIAYVVARILELLPQYSINSTEFRDTMRRYFGDNTDHFLHELYCFASTPYDMNGYDRHVQYTTDHTISTIVNDVLSSSESDASVDSDIVVISSSAPADAPPGPSRPPRPARAPAPVYPQSYITDGGGVVPIETISQSDTDDDSSEVVVVGYIKPPQDRTPEVVDLLGSDSDVIVQDGAPAEPAPREAEARPALVKLKLARAHASDSDSARTPSASPPPRRRRRHRRSGVESDPWLAPSSSSYETNFVTSPSESDDGVRPKAKWTILRRHANLERNRRREMKRERKHRKSKKDSNTSLGREKQNKHKSHSGKGVKSSRNAIVKNENTDRAQSIDQPGTSGMSRSGTRDVKSEMSRGTSETSRETSETSRGTSHMSRGTSEMLSGTSDMSRGTSEKSRGTSELSSNTGDISRNMSEISSNTSDISRNTSEISNSTNDISRGASEVLRGTSEGSHGSSGISRGTSGMSRGTSEVSHGSSGISRGTSGMSRGTSEVSHGSSGISRGTSGMSRGTSEVSHGSSGISRGTSGISRGTSEVSRDTTWTWRGTKRKMERNTRRRESKRLKSVVNVINSQKKSELASRVGAERATDSESEYQPTDSSDSDDDLPLNLSIGKVAR